MGVYLGSDEANVGDAVRSHVRCPGGNTRLVDGRIADVVPEE